MSESEIVIGMPCQSKDCSLFKAEASMLKLHAN